MTQAEAEAPVSIPPTHEYLPAFQEFLREAIQLSCGDIGNMIDDYPVTYGNSWKSNGDFQCFVAAAIYSRNIGMQKKLQASQQSEKEGQQEGCESCGADDDSNAKKTKTVSDVSLFEVGLCNNTLFNEHLHAYSRLPLTLYFYFSIMCHRKRVKR